MSTNQSQLNPADPHNCIRTGLTAIRFYVRPEDQNEFNSLFHELKSQLLPNGVLQATLFDEILHASWNIQRCTALEATLQLEAAQAGLLDPLLDDDFSRKLDRIYRYKKTHETSRRHAIAEYRRLKTEELWRTATETPSETSVPADTKSVATQQKRDRTASSRAHLNDLKAMVASVNLPMPRLQRSA